MPRRNISSFYYPQGFHLGHLFFIIKRLGERNFSFPLRPEDYNLGKKESSLMRQTSYKLWVLMEMGLVEDDRMPNSLPTTYQNLTSKGSRLYTLIKNNISEFPDNFFQLEEESWKTVRDVIFYIDFVKSLERRIPDMYIFLASAILEYKTVILLLRYLLHEKKVDTIEKSLLYEDFHGNDMVRPFHRKYKISFNTTRSAEHRLPILIGFLESIHIAEGYRQSKVKLLKIPLIPELFGHENEFLVTKIRRMKLFRFYSEALEKNADFKIHELDLMNEIFQDDIKELRELFGDDFMTPLYPIGEFFVVEQESLLKYKTSGEDIMIDTQELNELEKRETKTARDMPREKRKELIQNYQFSENRRPVRIDFERMSRDVGLYALLKADSNYTCQICGKKTFVDDSGNFHVVIHHKYRLRIPEDEVPDNILILCPICHARIHYGSEDNKIDIYSEAFQKGIDFDVEKLRERQLISDKVFECLKKIKK